jgi:hypothetical protein
MKSFYDGLIMQLKWPANTTQKCHRAGMEMLEILHGNIACKCNNYGLHSDSMKSFYDGLIMQCDGLKVLHGKISKIALLCTQM